MSEEIKSRFVKLVQKELKFQKKHRAEFLKSIHEAGINSGDIGPLFNGRHGSMPMSHPYANNIANELRDIEKGYELPL
jgi:hypothetical protein